MSKEKLFEVLWNHFPSESCCYIDEKLVDAILALFAGEPVYQIFEPYEGWRDTCLTGDEFEGVRDKKRILYTAPVADERDARISELIAECHSERDLRVRLSNEAIEYRAIMDNLYRQRDALQAQLKLATDALEHADLGVIPELEEERDTLRTQLKLATDFIGDICGPVCDDPRATMLPVSKLVEGWQALTAIKEGGV